MTTESKQDTRPGAFVLLGAAGAAFLAGLAMTLVAWLFADLTAVRSVAVSTLLVVVVIGFGVFVLNTVASIMPSATVLVALVTYATQLVVLAAVVLSLARNGMMDDTFDRRWFGGGVAVATLAWMVAQIVAHLRARIPVYDLPEAGAR
jgi:ATP synthase protein I